MSPRLLWWDHGRRSDGSVGAGPSSSTSYPEKVGDRPRAGSGWRHYRRVERDTTDDWLDALGTARKAELPIVFIGQAAFSAVPQVRSSAPFHVREGTALNFLDRFEESLPLLLEQAQILQPDAMSWFQLGVAYGNLSRAAEAIDAYEKALALDPDYDVAMFNLGGTYWNSHDLTKAAEIWKAASARFPDHKLTAKLKIEMPFLFEDKTLR